MERVSLRMKTPTGKCSEKDKLLSKDLQKTVDKIHEDNCEVVYC